MSRRKKMVKRVMSILTAFVMVVCLVPSFGGTVFVKAADDDEEWPRSVTFDADSAIKPVGTSEIAQTGLTGAMTPVTMTVSDTGKYYFPTDYTSLGVQDGITVARADMYHLTITGTPAKRSTTVTLAAPSIKATQNPPSSVAGGVEKITGTTTSMEYASSSTATSWTQCNAGNTSVAAGKWYVRYKSTDEYQPSSATEVNVISSSEANSVLVNISEAAAETMTHDTSSGALWQRNLTGAMEDVIINAKPGYYFPLDYGAVTKNGVTLSIESETKIKISGNPNAQTSVVFTLDPASRKKSTPSAPSNVTGGVLKLIGTTDRMEYANVETPDEWTPCTNSETEVETAGTKYVRYIETDTTNSGEIATVNVLQKPADTRPGYTVTIENPKGSHITIATETENLYKQTGVKDAMQNVYYDADNNYYFPVSYKVSSVNGIRVVRNGAKRITVKGTPTADTVITLEPAVAVNTPLYSVSVVDGEGSGSYVAGTAVDITAVDKEGLVFTGWKVTKGSASLLNSKSKSTTFVMPAGAVVVEACYSSGTVVSDDDKGGNNISVTPVDDASNISSGSNGTNGGNNSSNNNNNGNTSTTVPITAEIINNNSLALNLSAKVLWKDKAWKVTWGSISGADGYDVFVKQGKTDPSVGSVIQLAGKNSVTAKIKTVGGKSINKKKIYSFMVKAYRLSGNTKEYIGTSRVLYAAGSKNKSYTNVSKLKPSKKSVTISKGSRKKLQTRYKKQSSSSSKKLVSNSSGKKLNYYSSNPSVATVDAKGRVTGVAAGTCKVYAIAHNGIRTSVDIIVK